MRHNISITLTTPHVTIERYSELTGLSIDTINDMLADGRLIRHQKVIRSLFLTVTHP